MCAGCHYHYLQHYGLFHAYEARTQGAPCDPHLAFAKIFSTPPARFKKKKKLSAFLKRETLRKQGCRAAQNRPVPVGANIPYVA